MAGSVAKECSTRVRTRAQSGVLTKKASNVSKVCFTTVCSSNHYSYFIPVFVYSIKKAYPDAGVKVFVMGKLKDDIRAAMDDLRRSNAINNDWEIFDNRYSEYPKNESTCNSLRFLLNKENFSGYDYVFVRDVDFVVFRHKPTHLEYYAGRMGKKYCMYGVRGPYNYPRRTHINRSGWKGEYTRIAGGGVMLKNPEWFDRTEKMVKHYRQCLKYSRADGIDGHIAGSYREYDEVMLYRICKKSGIKVPVRKAHGVDGKAVDVTYRDIHLGDFCKANGFRKIRRKISKENVAKYIELEKDPVWQKIKAVSLTNKEVRVVLRRALKHVRSR